MLTSADALFWARRVELGVGPKGVEEYRVPSLVLRGGKRRIGKTFETD